MMTAYILVSLLLAVQPTAPPKQAVVETAAGTFIIDLDPEAAPNQVAYFMKLAQQGAFDGTTFHRVVKYGMVQGGDPLSKDPSKRALYGTGGLNVVKAEARAAKMTRGSVAAVLVPGKPDSAGAQFFIFVVDQPALDNKYTVFGRLSDGLEVVQKISETPVDAAGLATERVEIRHVTIRDTPPPMPEPFSTQSPQDLASYRAVLDTSAGPITVELFPDKAPGHVRQFLRLASSGVYDGMAFHRVAPGFVIQTGALASRAAPLTEKQQKLVRTLQPEFNDQAHQGNHLDGARRRPGERDDVVFYLHGGVSGARRSVHGVRTGRGRHGGRRGDRGGAAQRRNAGHSDRAQDGARGAAALSANPH